MEIIFNCIPVVEPVHCLHTIDAKALPSEAYHANKVNYYIRLTNSTNTTLNGIKV